MEHIQQIFSAGSAVSNGKLRFDVLQPAELNFFV